ncbi:APC family permease [[Actinomadura] parvosata]|uniref:APC family permease n=1 Tax=[Actinomadura] parvosata TaxID=1955412 RepID=UPI00406D17DD
MDDTTSHSAPSLETQQDGREHLQGHLGTGGLIFTALAFNAPLTVMAATVPIVISGGIGAGTPVVYLTIMALVLVFAVGLVAMARYMEKPGAFYTYIIAGLGRTVGLGGGFLAILTYLGLGASTYVVAGFSEQSLLHNNLGSPDIPWWVIVLVQWAVISWLSLRNIDISVRVLGVALAVEVLIVAVWSLAVVANGGPEGRSLDLDGQLATGSLGFALLMGLSCLGGFESIQVYRDETRNPVKTIPRATYLTVVFLAGFYGIGSYVYLIAHGTGPAMATAADPTNAFMASIAAYTGTFLQQLGYVLTWSSAAAALLAIHNIAARYVFALARDGVFPRWLARVHPRYKSPSTAAVAVSVTLLVVALAPATFQLDPVVGYTMQYGLASWCMVALFAGTALATVVFFARNRHLHVSVWKRLVAPVVALCGMSVVLYLATVQREALFGSAELGALGIGFLILVALGGALYARWLKARRPEVYERIGDQEENGVLVPLEHPPAIEEDEDFTPQVTARPEDVPGT